MKTTTLVAISVLLACGCSMTTTPYSPPKSGLVEAAPVDKSRIYFILWKAPETELQRNFELRVNGKPIASLNNQTYAEYLCAPGQLKLELRITGPNLLSEAVPMVLTGGLLGAAIGTGIVAAVHRNDKDKLGPIDSCDLTVEAGKSYVVEFEPPPAGSKALFQLDLLSPSMADQRLANARRVPVR